MQAGFYNRRHYTTYPNEVRALKRQGGFVKAMNLVPGLVESICRGRYGSKVWWFAPEWETRESLSASVGGRLPTPSSE